MNCADRRVLPSAPDRSSALIGSARIASCPTGQASARQLPTPSLPACCCCCGMVWQPHLHVGVADCPAARVPLPPLLPLQCVQLAHEPPHRTHGRLLAHQPQVRARVILQPASHATSDPTPAEAAAPARSPTSVWSAMAWRSTSAPRRSAGSSFSSRTRRALLKGGGEEAAKDRGPPSAG